MTHATEIWDVFDDMQNFDEYDVPSSVDGRRSLISASCMIYNKYMRIIDDVEVRFNKATDMLNVELDDIRIEILAKCMVLKISQDIYIDFTESYGMNQTTLGFKDFKAQADHKSRIVEKFKQDIIETRFSMSDNVYV